MSAVIFNSLTLPIVKKNEIKPIRAVIRDVSLAKSSKIYFFRSFFKKFSLAACPYYKFRRK